MTVVLKHIAFLTPEYPHPKLSRSGGLGTSIKNSAFGLLNYNTRVTVFVVGQHENTTFKDEGIDIVVLAKQKYFAFNWYVERKRIQKFIQNYIYAQSIQLIEAPDWTGLSAFMKFSVPLVIRLNGSDGYFCYLEERTQKKKHRFLERQALLGADAIVSVSEFTGKTTKHVFNLKRDIETIHNSIAVDKFLHQNVPVIPNQLLYFGTIIRKKGVLELAKTFNLLVEKRGGTALLLIGKDTMDVFENTSTLELFYSLLSAKAKSKVSYIEEVPYESIKIHIARATVVVLPSFAEAFPMTWLEALSMKKALVSSNIGWANELMIDGKTGFTVNPKSHKEFAEKLIQLLDSDDLRKQFGENGRTHVINNFSTVEITKENINFYTEIVAK